MTPKRLLPLSALGLTALTLSACHRHHHGFGLDHPVTVASTLDCPTTQGALTRVSADGHACAYRKGDDEQVTLAITPLNGQDAVAALAPTEAALRKLAPMAAAPTPATASDATDSGEHTKVDAPFVHVETHGDKADVKVFGVNIHADNDQAHVDTHWGGKDVEINSGPDGAEVHVRDWGPGGANMMLILTTSRPGPEGWGSVGYIARGPAAGPLLVATFKSRTKRDQNMQDQDLNQLIRLNVHG